MLADCGVGRRLLIKKKKKSNYNTLPEREYETKDNIIVCNERHHNVMLGNIR